LWVIFALLDQYPDSGYGSTDLIESGSSTYPDLKPLLVRLSFFSELYRCRRSVKQDKMVRVVMKMEKKENRRTATAGHTAYEKGEAAAASKMMAKAERNVAKAEQKMAKAAAAKVARVGQKMAKAAAEEEKAGQTGPLAEATAAAATVVEPSAAHSCIKKSSAASDAVIIDVGPSEATANRVCTQLPVSSSYPSYPLISVVRDLFAQPSPPPVNIMAAKGYAVFLPDGPNVDITDVSI
jgi:hypothetical protein